MARFTAGYTLDEDHQDHQYRPDQREEDAREPYVWDRDYLQVTHSQLHRPPGLGYVNNQIRTLIGGCCLTASSLYQQNMMMKDQHRRHFPHLTSANVSSRIGFNRDPSTPPNSPTRPGPRIRQREASWEMQPLGHTKRLSGMYAREGTGRDRVSQVSSLPRIKAIYSPEPSTGSLTHISNSTQRRLCQS